MLNPRIANRYAKSLIDLAIQSGRLEQIYQDMILIQSLFRQSRELTAVVDDPVVTPDRKLKLFRALLGQRVDPITQEFCDLVIRKGREVFLPGIADAAIAQYRRINHITRVRLTTAVEIDPEMANTIVTKVNAVLPMEHIDLETLVDPKLIGGFVLETGDNLLDASILHELKDIRRGFLENTYLNRFR